MTQGLEFQLEPWSLPGLLVLAVFGFLGWLHWRRLAPLPRPRRLPLLALRALVLLALLLVVLGPRVGTRRTFQVPLPPHLTNARLANPPEEVLAAWLPPQEALARAAAPKGELRLQSLGPPIAALYKNRDRLAVELEADLAADLDAELTLFDLSDPEGPSQISRSTVPLKAGTAGGRAELPFVPERLEGQVLGVVLTCPKGVVCPVHEDTVRVEVLRPQLRVLHLAGHPSWELRFLRQHLKGHPRYELVSFYVLANQENFQPLPPEDLALIPFPTDELFLQELPGFDLLIVQDFPLGSYFLLKDEHLKAMKDFVAGGGGLLFFGGAPANAGASSWAGGLEELLPLLHSGEGPAQTSAVLPAPEALGHPILRLEPPLPQELPPLGTVGGLGQVAPGGLVLLRQREGAPVLAVGRFAQGRVAHLATDGLWTWAFSGPEAGALPTIYAGLLDNLAAWLTAEPGFEDAWLEDEPRLTAGQGGSLKVCSNAKGPFRAELQFQPLGAGQSSAHTLPLDLDRGCASIKLPGRPVGAWRLVLWEAAPGALTPALVRQLPVGRSPEASETRLGRLLARTLPPPQPPPALPRTEEVQLLPAQASLGVLETEGLWDNPWLLGLLVALLGADWVLRRRAGLP